MIVVRIRRNLVDIGDTVVISVKVKAIGYAIEICICSS